jgi:hypothetical protein
MFDPEAFVRRLLVAGLAVPETILGCTEGEISLIESHFEVNLPEAYKAFLKTAGKQAGVLFVPDIDIFFPKVLELRGRALETLDIFESGSLTLPQHSFVFSDRYGEQFMFFICDGDSSDPPVYLYYQGRGAYEQISNQFSDIVEKELGFLEDFKKRDPNSPYWDYLKKGCKGPLVFD